MPNSIRINNKKLSRQLVPQGWDIQAFWDPMILFDRDCYFVYVLKTSQAQLNPNEEFFLRPSYIHGYKTHDFRNFVDLGPIISCETGEKLCSGSLIKEDDVIYFFYSANIATFSRDELDQRVFLATSKDGENFIKDRNFSLEPNPNHYSTNQYNPLNREMIFAWRDPYIFKDPVSCQYYLYISAGGFRWNCPPQVAVASSEFIQGPYTLHKPALDFDLNQATKSPFGEIERVNVFYLNNRYYLFASCFKPYCSKDFINKLQNNGIRVFTESTYVFVSDNPFGPFSINDECPVVIDKTRPRHYGKYLFQGKKSQIYTIGSITPSQRKKNSKGLEFNGQKLKLIFSKSKFIVVHDNFKDSLFGYLGEFIYLLFDSFQRIFTPTNKDREFLKLPDYAYFLYYLLRPIRLLGKYTLIAWKRLLPT